MVLQARRDREVHVTRRNSALRDLLALPRGREVAEREGLLVSAPKGKPPASEMPKWEAAYEREVLMPAQHVGEVSRWRWHPFRFVLFPGERQSYEPDFLVEMRDGSLEIHEVKGFEREDSIEKFKTAAQQHPWFRFVMVTREKHGAWTVTRRIERRLTTPARSEGESPEGVRRA